ncbi:hypothetical protein MNV49_006798 [Pseudohyphozyma bogoriensis]|nr:hypothetical protein MNV49_006798 [Pseudohyphozyma bogoriensis]
MAPPHTYAFMDEPNAEDIPPTLDAKKVVYRGHEKLNIDTPTPAPPKGTPRPATWHHRNRIDYNHHMVNARDVLDEKLPILPMYFGTDRQAHAGTAAHSAKFRSNGAQHRFKVQPWDNVYPEETYLRYFDTLLGIEHDITPEFVENRLPRGDEILTLLVIEEKVELMRYTFTKRDSRLICYDPSYSEKFKCEQFILTDYHGGVAINVSRDRELLKIPKALPFIATRQCRHETDFKSNSPFAFGMKESAVFMMWSLLGS